MSLVVAVRSTTLFLVLLVCFYMGVVYGLNGDPLSYAETGKNLLLSFSEGSYRHIFSVDPLFRLILFAIEFVTPLSVEEPITYVLISFLSIITSFFLLNGWYRGIVSYCFFVTTIIGFLVTFNLTRTAISILIFSVAYSLVFKGFRDFQRLGLSMICASFAHLSWLPLIFITSISFLITIKKNSFQIIFSFGIFFLLTLVSINPELISFYLEREWARKEQESGYALFTPTYMFLLTLIINFYRKEFSKNLLYILNITFVLCLAAIFFGFPLVFERLAVPFLFLTAILIPRFLPSYFLIPIIIINFVILFIRVV